MNKRIVKRRRRLFYMAVLTASLSLVLWAMTLSSQGTLTTTPDSITVASSGGQVEQRTMLIHATTPISKLQAIPLDLTTSDGAVVLPASAIQVDLSATAIAANGVLTLPIQINLARVPRGEFSGQLWLHHASGAMGIPIIVRVKDGWLLPLSVLLIGVALGMALSYYRSSGRARDEVLVRVTNLRTQLRADIELASDVAKPFRSRLENTFTVIESALQSADYAAAQQAMREAETLWGKWFRGREDWLAQLKYAEELTKKLEPLKQESPYVQSVRNAMNEAVRNAPTLDDASTLRTQLDAPSQQLKRYLQLQARINVLNGLRNQLEVTHEAYESWRLKCLDLEQRLDTLPSADVNAHTTLLTEVESAINELTQVVHAAKPKTDEGIQPAATPRGLQDAGNALLSLLLPPPSITLKLSAIEETNALNRLRWFTWISYGIALLLLVSAGFSELYLANETFGANGWSDYFVLLAWGFGVEATRTAVTQLAQSWGMLTPKAEAGG